MKAIDAKSIKISELLDELTDRTPESLFVTNLNILDANSIVMNGRARDYGSVSEFALLLRQTEHFDSVRINSITANPTVSETYTDYGFSMSIIIKADY